MSPWGLFARELAAAATRREAEAAIHRWKAACPRSEHGSASLKQPEPPGRLGIWRRVSIQGEPWFVRDEKVPDTGMWADVDRIGPRRDRKRVVLLGESCARGWPLDPLFNCASALGTCVTSVAGVNAVEIVDLARNAIQPERLLGLAEAAAALEPDVYVVFAGNNFGVDPRRLDLDAMSAALAASGWRGVIPLVEQVFRAQLAAWMAELARAVRGTPTVFVVPAENARDRWLLADLPNPLLGSAEQAAREDLAKTVTALCGEGNWAEAEPLAAKLVALEDECSVRGLEALARCALARDARAEAVRLFEDARELAFLGLDSYLTRRDELRARAAESGFRVVDLPRCFMEMTGGVPPGRELFLDHCHMTARGVVAAMAAAAEQVLPLLALPAVSRDALLRIPVAVEPRAEAQAHFVAAALNIDNEELARYHCEYAVKCSPEIVDVMLHYVDLRLRRVPPVFCDAFSRLKCLQSRFPALKRLGMWPQIYQRDAMLIRLIPQAIADERPDAVARCQALLRRKYSVGRTAIDLLPHATTGDFDGFSNRGGYVTCYRRTIDFHLIAEELPPECRFRVTTRAGEDRSVGKTAALFVNGELVHTWPLHAKWTTVDCVADSSAMTDGVNVLTIVWPDPDQRREDQMRRVARAIAEWNVSGDAVPGVELRSRIYPVWGEIHAFTARLAGAREQETVRGTGVEPVCVGTESGGA